MNLAQQFKMLGTLTPNFSDYYEKLINTMREKAISGAGDYILEGSDYFKTVQHTEMLRKQLVADGFKIDQNSSGLIISWINA